MNTGEHYYSWLTEEEKQEFKANFGHEDSFQKHIERQYNMMWRFIADAFSWGNSNEDFAYWEKISKRQENYVQYLSDDMYLPIHYKGAKVAEPFYSGDGEHSVKQLEEICRQQAAIKQNCMEHIVELKFGIDLSV